MSDFFTPTPPRVLAHRGLALGVPENTLAAFTAAVAAGATYLETDVHATKDGVAVLMHDPDLSRIAGLPVKVSELTLAELQAVDLGDEHRVPTLAQALEAFPEARFNVDVKSAAAALPATDAIRQAGAVDRVLIASFSERRARSAGRRLPGVATSASGTRFALALAATKLGVVPLARFILRKVDAVQVPERHFGVRITTARVIRRLKRARVEVHVWTINDTADMVRLLDLGVDGIVTDRCDLALELVAHRARQRS